MFLALLVLALLLLAVALLYSGQGFWAWVLPIAALLGYWAYTTPGSQALFLAVALPFLVLALLFGVAPLRRAVVTSV